MKKLICILLVCFMTVSLAGCDIGSLFDSDSSVETVQDLTEAEKIAVEYAKGNLMGDKEIEDKYFYFSNKDLCQANIKKYDDMNNEMDFLKHEERVITVAETGSYDYDIEPVYIINSWDDYYNYYRKKGLETLSKTYGDNVTVEVGVITPRDERWPEGQFDSFIKDIESDDLKSLVLDTSLFSDTTTVYMTTLRKGSDNKERARMVAFMVKYDGVWKIADAYGMA